jgi:myo-inositol-1(or 4)-monophosphatase
MEFLSACDQMAELVQESIRDLAGTSEGGKIVKMGADLTPTKKIDQVAEDCVVAYLQEHP